MKKWATTIRAIDPLTGELTTWGGPNVPGLTHAMAEQHCQENGLGYCRVDGELIMVIPTLSNGFTPDWGNAIDYEQPGLN